MAGEAAEFLLSLTDSVTPNAIKIANGLESMSGAQIRAVSNSLKLDAAMAKSRAAMAGAAAAESKAAEAARKLAEANGTAAKGGGELSGSLADMGGQATQTGGAMGKVQEVLGKLGPEGQAAAAGLGVLTIAVTAVVGSLLAMGAAAIGVIEQLSQMTTIFGALAGGAAAGGQVTAMVQKLGQELPFATSQIAEWTQALQRAGVAGKDLEAATRAIAAAAALNPAGGAEAAQSTIAKLASGGKEATDLIKSIAEGSKKGAGALREMGLTVADLGGKAAVAKMSAEELTKAIEKALIKKGADPLAEMAMTWPAIVQKAKEGLLSLFDKLGPAVKPFMAAVKSLFGEFSKGGGVIKFLKPIVTSVFTTLFSWATAAVGAVKGIVQWLLKSGSAGGMFSGVVEALRSGWHKLVGVFTILKATLAPIVAILKAIFSNAMVLNGIKTIFTVIATAAVFVVTTFLSIVAVIGMVIGFFAGLIGAAVGFATGVVGAVADVGASIVDGLVGGLDPSAFIAKMAGMASAGLAAFKGILGIASPSTVMIEHGKEDIAGGAAQGVDAGAGKVHKAMARMGDADAGGGKGKADGKGGGASFEFNNCNFGGADEGTIRSMFERVWEELAGEAGASPATA